MLVTSHQGHASTDQPFLLSQHPQTQHLSTEKHGSLWVTNPHYLPMTGPSSWKTSEVERGLGVMRSEALGPPLKSQRRTWEESHRCL